MSAQIPVLTTDRLSMRGHQKSDLKDCIELWSNPVVTRYIGGRAFTSEEVWTRVLRYVGHWALLGFGYWLVCERSTGAFVGEVGFANFEREITPSLGDAPEAGWITTPAARGQGYAQEAIRAAHAWIEEVYGATRTVCLIDHGNVISQHIARSCGYSVYSDTSYHGNQVHLYERSSQLR